jgi:hypothetical protein
MQTLVMACIDDAKRGRVMALFNVSWGGLITIGAPLLGLIAGRVGTPRAFGMGGAICLIYGLYRALGSRGVGPQAAGYTAAPTSSGVEPTARSRAESRTGRPESLK